MTGVVAVAVVTLSTFSAAFRTPAVVHHPTGRDDLSYGVYLLSYPVQQTLVAAGVRHGALVLLGTIVVVGPLSWLTWRAVERPMLRLKPARPTQSGRMPSRTSARRRSRNSSTSVT